MKKIKQLITSRIIFITTFLLIQSIIKAQTTNYYTSFASTSEAISFNLEKGVYNVGLKIFINPNTTIKKISTQITNPWTNIEWDIDGLKKGEWIQLSKEVELDIPAKNANFRIQVNNDPAFGGGIGAFFIDDILIEEKDNTLSLDSFDTTDVLFDYKIYPNPTNDLINVKLKSIANYTLYSTSGLLVDKSKKPSLNFEIKTSDLNSGIYFLKINSEKGLILKKIVVE